MVLTLYQGTYPKTVLSHEDTACMLSPVSGPMEPLLTGATMLAVIGYTARNENKGAN